VNILRGRETQFDGISVRYIPRRMLILKRPSKAAVRVYDIYGFFQTSFEEALRKMGIQIPELVSQGKRARAEFSWADLDFVREYNRVECQMMEQLAHALTDSFERAGIPGRSLYGPGALAERLLWSWKIRRQLRGGGHSRHYFAAMAYFGGRIETPKIGYMEDLYIYDINSAYPWAVTRLWDQRKSEYEWGDFEPGNPYGMFQVEFSFPTDTYLCPLPFRSQSGSIYYPLEGRGIYWAEEVESALQMRGRVKVYSGWVIRDPVPSTLCQLVPELFAKRKEMEQNGEYQQSRALKLALNSLYGKMVQSQGRAPFFSMEWAGFVTAAVRKKLWEAVRFMPDTVVSLATDGVILMGVKPRDFVGKIGENLGEWKASGPYAGYVLGSGIYRLEGPDGVRMGVRGGSMDWSDIPDQLNRQGYAIVRDKVFVSPLLAILHPNVFGPYRGRWMVRERIICPWRPGSKRIYYIHGADWRIDYRDSLPVVRAGDISEPYIPKGEDEARAEVMAEEDI
jgi:hypothetical protein